MGRFESWPKTGIFICYHGYMRVFEYKRSMAFFDPGLSRYDNFKHIRSNDANCNQI